MTDVSATLAERGGRYGKFADHAAIAQGIQEVLHAAPNWTKLDPDMRQALCVIADKMARILNGDPYYDDNWHDIQGYAKLVETRIREMQAPAEELMPVPHEELTRFDDEGGAMKPVAPTPLPPVAIDSTHHHFEPQVEYASMIPQNILAEGGAFQHNTNDMQSSS